MNDEIQHVENIVLKKNGINGKNGHCYNHIKRVDNNQDIVDEETKELEKETNNIKKCVDESEVTASEGSINILNSIKTAILLTSLFFWYLLISFIGIFHTKKKSIRNETVLITGAAGYLGRQLAFEFAKHGATVILWDYNKEENKKTYNYIREAGYKRVYAYKVDLTDEKQVRSTANRVKEKHGFVSMLVLAAATPCEIESVFNLTHDKLDKSFKLFYESHVWLYQEFLPSMIEKNHGHLALISSETVFTKLAFIHTYSSFKAAQAKLFETVDGELNYIENNQIKTTLVYLGGLKQGISTSMIKKFLPNNPIGFKCINKIGMSNEYASKRIVKSVLKNQKYVYLPLYVYIIVFIKYLLPEKCFDLLFTSKNFMDNSNLLVHSRSKEILKEKEN